MSIIKKENYIGSGNPFYGKHHTKEAKEKILTNRKNLVPNNAEITLLGIIQSLGFQYVGDGKLVIAGKCPDYWNGNSHLIELFGDYWHRGQDPQVRINYFAENGFNCLVIWEHELLNKEDIFKKVSDFIGLNSGSYCYRSS